MHDVLVKDTRAFRQFVIKMEELWSHRPENHTTPIDVAVVELVEHLAGSGFSSATEGILLMRLGRLVPNFIQSWGASPEQFLEGVANTIQEDLDNARVAEPAEHV